MTGRMSDNPADSLRRELEAAAQAQNWLERKAARERAAQEFRWTVLAWRPRNIVKETPHG